MKTPCDMEILISEQAVNRFINTPNPRLKVLMQSLVRHLHSFVSEVELTEEEWFAAIQFLTETGKMCDGKVRQEFILLSDTLGVSMLVDAINHRHTSGVTDSTVFGPFFIAGMSERGYGENMALTAGVPSLVYGRVSSSDGTPLANVVLDVWQTADNGMYSGQDPNQQLDNLRGRYRTDAEGRYAIRSIMPTSYPIPSDGPVGRMLEATARHPWRPAHLHFMLEAPHHRKLVTHLFNAGDPYLDSDPVFGVKESLLVEYRECEADSMLGRQFGFSGAFRAAHFDFVLERYVA